MNAKILEEEIKNLYNEEYATHHAKFFQTHKGGYGEGDLFYGARAPELRAISKKYQAIELAEIQQLLKNPYHEVRTAALFIMVLKYKKEKDQRKNLYELYLKNLDHINNWDLVDTTAQHIIGPYVFENNSEETIWQLANSNKLWHERVAMIAPLYHIKKDYYDLTIKLAEHFLPHRHHLMHKASGWMLREVGKRDIIPLKTFLDKHSKIMPRTMLRYAIEKLSPEEKTFYMKK